MRKNNLLFMLILAMAAIVYSACNKDDNDEVTPVYSYGITSANYTSVTTLTDPAAPTEASEMTTITDAFADAFKSALGVTGTPFSYNGGDNKVIAACKQAEETLKDKTFRGRYSFEVYRVDGSKVIYTWSSPEPKTEPEPNPVAEMPEYTILFYGHGGGNLDGGIMDNIEQFFYAESSNLKKVNVAVQYKFSTAEDLYNSIDEEDLNRWAEMYGLTGEELALNLDMKTMRFGIVGDTEFGEDDHPFYANTIPDEDNYLDDENLDFGDPKNLVEFIKWGVKNYPAKKYILLLSDHGGGYTPHDDTPTSLLSKGLIYDDGNPDQSWSGNSHLTIGELTDAISASGIKPEVIYLDACLMNSIEYQFELKDLANYLILSTFIVPGLGGNYTSLVNELATNNIETALSNFANATMATWDDSQEYKYSDMSVIRTSGLDAFGALWKDFTDRLIDAYTNGGGEVKDKIDDATGCYTLLVDDSTPSYAMTTYGANLADAVPDYFPESFTTQIEDAYDNCVVEAVASKILTENDWLISCSVLLGAQNHYSLYDWMSLDVAKEAIVGTDIVLNEDCINGEKYMCKYTVFNADGTGKIVKTTTGNETPFNWNASFDNTYRALKWDQATGWSRWIEINEQDPVDFSPINFDYNFANDSFTPTK